MADQVELGDEPQVEYYDENFENKLKQVTMRLNNNFFINVPAGMDLVL